MITLMFVVGRVVSRLEVLSFWFFGLSIELYRVCFALSLSGLSYCLFVSFWSLYRELYRVYFALSIENSIESVLPCLCLVFYFVFLCLFGLSTELYRVCFALSLPGLLYCLSLSNSTFTNLCVFLCLFGLSLQNSIESVLPCLCLVFYFVFFASVCLYYRVFFVGPVCVRTTYYVTTCYVLRTSWSGQRTQIQTVRWILIRCRLFSVTFLPMSTRPSSSR